MDLTSTHDYAGQRVTVMGLGRFGGGVGVARFLSRRGAQVLVTDMLSADELADSVSQLKGCVGVSFRLGEHCVGDFTTCDFLVVNPAVKPGNRFVQAAQDAGVRITSEIRLLVRHLPNRLKTVGITGSAGKSTVTAMVGHVLEQAFGAEGLSGLNEEERFKVWVGGNIGGSLLEKVDEIGANDWVVLELSSFMLEGLGEDRWSPHVAVVTNVSPNHLDWHGAMEVYVAAKRVLLEFQVGGDVARMGVSAYEAFDLLGEGDCDAAWNRRGEMDDCILEEFSCDGNARVLCNLPGRHNRLNAVFATAVAECVLLDHDMNVGERDCVGELIHTALMSFSGLAHRLQFVGEWEGVRYYNDSKSTTPEAAALAIESFDPQTVRLVLGGSDKGSDLSALARLAAGRCSGVYTLGATGDTIADAAERAANGIKNAAVRPESCGGVAWPLPVAHVQRCGTLDAALEAIVADVRPGENVVLSPACASWDQFANYQVRGEAFVAWLKRRLN
ncbi:MAG: UDP-N-acetylmuramoyl-L-alanine--D-glutamate ligase [Algisphaera sp.]